MNFKYLRSSLLGAALALTFAHAHEARADVPRTSVFFKYDDSAAANCKSGGSLFATYFAGTWSRAARVTPGLIDSVPSSVYNPTARKTSVFARDLSGSLVATVYQNNGWTPMQAIVDTKIGSAPSAVYTASKGETVFAFNGNRELIATWYDAAQGRWVTPEVLVSSPAVGNPSAVVTASGRVMVFARSLGNRLTATWYDAAVGKWVDWWTFPYDTRINSNPAAVVSKEGRLHVFARDRQRHIAVTYYENGWQPFTAIDSTLTSGNDPHAAEESWSDPSAVVDASGRLTVFYLDYDKTAGAAQPVGLWYEGTGWKRVVLPVTNGVICSGFGPIYTP